MDRTSARTRLRDFGFDFLEDAHANQLLDWACQEANREELWPWRLTVVAGASPLTVPDLGPIDTVASVSGTVLAPRRASEIIDLDPTLALSGQASRYYVERSIGAANAATRIVRAWPVDGQLITVRHHTQACWVANASAARTSAAGADTDHIAGEPGYEELVITLARRRAHADNGDYEQAAAADQEYQGLLEKARQDWLVTNWDEPDAILPADVW